MSRLKSHVSREESGFSYRHKVEEWLQKKVKTWMVLLIIGLEFYRASGSVRRRGGRVHKVGKGNVQSI